MALPRKGCEGRLSGRVFPVLYLGNPAQYSIVVAREGHLRLHPCSRVGRLDDLLAVNSQAHVPSCANNPPESSRVSPCYSLVGSVKSQLNSILLPGTYAPFFMPGLAYTRIKRMYFLLRFLQSRCLLCVIQKCTTNNLRQCAKKS